MVIVDAEKFVVCPEHGEAKGEQVRAVLSKLSDEDLRILNDSLPYVLYSGLSVVAGARCLHRMAVAKAQTIWPLTV